MRELRYKILILWCYVVLFWTGGFSSPNKRSLARVYCIQAFGKSVKCFEKMCILIFSCELIMCLEFWKKTKLLVQKWLWKTVNESFLSHRLLPLLFGFHLFLFLLVFDLTFLEILQPFFFLLEVLLHNLPLQETYSAVIHAALIQTLPRRHF